MNGSLHDLRELRRVTDALYQADLARLRAIAAEERRLRDEIAALNESARRAEEHSGESALALRQLGGDMLWRAWLGRKREALHLRLANVMARKLSAADALRRSFGKNEVARKLAEAAQHDAERDAALRRLAEEQAQMLLGSATRGGSA